MLVKLDEVNFNSAFNFDDNGALELDANLTPPVHLLL